MTQTVSQHLATIALERGLRQSTVLGYERLLRRMNLLDASLSDVDQSAALEGLWLIDNPNTRRSAVIMLRAVFGWKVKIPKAVPRRYELPSEDTLRLALMCSPHEVRGLLMLYCGLRIGEACAVTSADLDGTQLRVDKQILELHRKGSPTTWRLGPVKTSEAAVNVPVWLCERLKTLDGTARPGQVRESLRRAGAKVGIPLNPHMLRHACATLLLERGVPMMVVSKHLRHSDVATTLRTYAQHNSGKYIQDAFG